MFRAAKLGRKVSKDFFREQVPELRTALLDAQAAIKGGRTSVVVIIAGVEGAGKGEVVNRLNEWLDTRGVQTHAFWEQTDEETARPPYWRFWRALPPRGEIAIHFGGWYLEPIEHRYHGTCTDTDLDEELARIAQFERMLIEDGALVVKFWFHLSEQEQKKRLKELARDDRSRWKMLPNRAKFSEEYNRFEQIAERVIRHTDTGIAPWFLIEATDRRYRDLTAGQTLLRALRGRLEHPEPLPPVPLSTAPSLPTAPEAQVTLIDRMDLEQRLEVQDYAGLLKKLQDELNEKAWSAYKAKRSTVLVFEGVDAAGKGGTIRRITTAVDARLYRTITVAAPTDEEKAHHYLWRFWRHIPRHGYITVYDRSWYGRILVERVEGFAKHGEWQRAYNEINEFEEQLTESGVIVIKFWMQISKDEQLRRFQERTDTPYKQHKITDEDWRNREKWDDYKLAVNEMVIRTSTEYAPWHLVAGDDKRYARVEVLRTVAKRLEAALADKISPLGPSGSLYQRRRAPTNGSGSDISKKQ
jgi:polyphosphate:AMP phosphotransferase